MASIAPCAGGFVLGARAGFFVKACMFIGVLWRFFGSGVRLTVFGV